jgi:hypothetical protein
MRSSKTTIALKLVDESPRYKIYLRPLHMQNIFLYEKTATGRAFLIAVHTGPVQKLILFQNGVALIISGKTK